MGEDHKLIRLSQHQIFKVLLTQPEASLILYDKLEIDKKYRWIMIDHQICMTML